MAGVFADLIHRPPIDGVLTKGKTASIIYGASQEALAMPRDTSNTVTGIARRICRDGDPAEIKRLAEQIRYWTRERLLRPEGAIHSGTGRWRTYAQAETHKAAILHELSRRGMTVGAMALFMSGLRANEWQAARDDRETSYIDMALETVRTIWLEVFEPGARGPSGRDDVLVVGWDEGGVSHAPDTARWSLRLNLTRILDGVRE